MTNEEAKVFLDNLKICIDEHPVVADWLVEIADRKTEPQTDCEFCQNHEQGDTLYEPSDWDGGIGFDYIRDIKYCPLCGAMLKGANDETEMS